MPRRSESVRPPTCLPEPGDAEPVQRRIGRDQRQPLQQRLGDQDAVERVAVVAGQAAGGLGMGACDRQQPGSHAGCAAATSRATRPTPGSFPAACFSVIS